MMVAYWHRLQRALQIIHLKVIAATAADDDAGGIARGGFPPWQASGTRALYWGWAQAQQARLMM